MLIVILAFVLRVVNLEKLFYFTYDESIPAFVGRRLILTNHIPLIGGVTPFGFHLGPYFYWLLALLLYIGKLNPIVWGIAGALLGSATTFMAYVAGQKFLNKKAGVTAAVFWAFSFLANLYDRHFWALSWGPIISLIVLFSLHGIIKGNSRFVYPLAVSVAFGIHADPSNLVFVLLVGLVWAIYKLPITRHTLLATSLIIFSFLPLVAFDLRHDFANTRPMISHFKNFSNRQPDQKTLSQRATDNAIIFPAAFARLVYTLGDNEVSKQYSYCGNYVAEKTRIIPVYLILLASSLLTGFALWGFNQKTKNPAIFISALLLVVYFLGIQLYGTLAKADIFEHYISGTFAIFLLILAKVVSKLPRKLWLVVLAIFVGANLYKLLIATNSHGLTQKREAIEYVNSRVGDAPFSLESVSTCWKYNGYRYLFTVFGKEPVKSYVDPNFAYLYGTTTVWETHPGTVIAFVTHDFSEETEEFYKRYALLKSHEVSSGIFGNIEVIMMDNQIKWFDDINTSVKPPSFEQQR
ncbi:MAG: hypothetical protein NUV69_04370 [Candidatus Curtissbacteria bacterium]|nr:hypothetical protein [Candidatus Curtissbacteria bacterium]